MGTEEGDRGGAAAAWHTRQVPADCTTGASLVPWLLPWDSWKSPPLRWAAGGTVDEAQSRSAPAGWSRAALGPCWYTSLDSGPSSCSAWLLRWSDSSWQQTAAAAAAAAVTAAGAAAAAGGGTSDSAPELG